MLFLLDFLKTTDLPGESIAIQQEPLKVLSFFLLYTLVPVQDAKAGIPSSRVGTCDERV